MSIILKAAACPRVDAKGNVRVVQGDRIATGSSIVFNNANQTIVATGDPADLAGR